MSADLCRVPSCVLSVSKGLPLCGEHYAHLSDRFQRRLFEAVGTVEIEAVLGQCLEYLVADQRRAAHTAELRAANPVTARARGPVRRYRGDGRFGAK